jgi:TetR/AcrR family transcriptional regulator, cholesterol catabolism regulator
MQAKIKTKKVIAQVANEAIVEKKHKQIVRAAGEIFSKKGYHAASMRDIAAASGINLSYLYKYVSSKNDILFLFYDHLHKRWDSIFRSLEEENPDPVIQLKDFLQSMLDIVHHLKYEILTMYTESRHLDRDSLHTVMAAESKMIKTLERLIRRGITRGRFKTEDPFMAAHFIEFLLVVEAMRGWNFNKKYSFSRFSGIFIDFVLRALGAAEKKK